MGESRWRVVVKAGAPRAAPPRLIAGQALSGRFEGGPRVRLEGITAVGVDFSGLKFEYLGTEGCYFERCDFRRVRLEAASIDGHRSSRFVGCRFDGFRPTPGAIFGSSRFEDCSFENLKLKNWWPVAAEFVGCRFSGVLDGLQLWGAPPPPWNQPGKISPRRTRNEIRGNDFTRAELRYPDFRGGLDLAVNRWPTGDDYLYLDRWAARVDKVRQAVSRWPVEADRERALWWLRIHASDGHELQQQILVRTPDWTDIEPRDLWPRLWMLLRTDLPA
jgi:hypothetical protein